MANIYKDQYGGTGYSFLKGNYNAGQIGNDLVYKPSGNSNYRSNISGYKITDTRYKIIFYKTENCTGTPYEKNPTTNNRYSLVNDENDSFRSFRIVCINNNPECFENKSSFKCDNTNNYILFVLIIVSFFYMCRNNN